MGCALFFENMGKMATLLKWHYASILSELGVADDVTGGEGTISPVSSSFLYLSTGLRGEEGGREASPLASSPTSKWLSSLSVNGRRLAASSFQSQGSWLNLFLDSELDLDDDVRGTGSGLPGLEGTCRGCRTLLAGSGCSMLTWFVPLCLLSGRDKGRK